MKPLLFSLLLLPTVGCEMIHSMHASPAPPAVWTLTNGVDTPESVYIDSASSSIFVSMIVGAPDARDGNGRIARLRQDGSLVSASWVTGLNAPKGLRSHNGVLWTADLDEVIGIEISSARITTRVRIPEAKFLNDVACGADGTVYVSDMLASKIYAVKDGRATIFAEGEDLEYPNGILLDGDRLIVGGWGKPEADFSTKVPGRLFSLDLKTAKKSLITEKPTANIDGLESDGHHGWYISEWSSGKILRVMANGSINLVAKFAPGTADIAFTHVGHILIVPHMTENKIVAYDLSEQ